MKKHIGYIIYNILYQLFCFWLLLLLGMYYNDIFIPKTFNPALGRILLLAIEASILIVTIYIINNLILSDTENKEKRTTITRRTLWININVFLIFILLTAIH